MEEDPKQWIIIRKDLNMRKGKMVSQGAHASMKAVLHGLRETDNSCKKLIHGIDYDFYLKEVAICFHKDSAMDKWLTGIFTKITLYVNSEEELMEVYNKTKEEGILCALIEDNGKTEFGGVKTKTAAAIGPEYPSKVKHIVGHLPLL